jgi:hypothetical protein
LQGRTLLLNRNQALDEEMSDTSYVLPILAKLSSRFDSSDYKLLDVRGIPQNPSFTVSKFEDIIDSFQTRDGDVFISTFVKAGEMPDTSPQELPCFVASFDIVSPK